MSNVFSNPLWPSIEFHKLHETKKFFSTSTFKKEDSYLSQQQVRLAKAKNKEDFDKLVQKIHKEDFIQTLKFIDNPDTINDKDFFDTVKRISKMKSRSCTAKGIKQTDGEIKPIQEALKPIIQKLYCPKKTPVIKAIVKSLANFKTQNPF